MVFLVAVAVVIFMYGLVQVIFKAGGDRNAVGEAKKKILWGIIILFIMTTLWGIIFLMQGLLGFHDNIGSGDSGNSGGGSQNGMNMYRPNNSGNNSDNNSGGGSGGSAERFDISIFDLF
jgi:hypothetical protein